MIQISTQYVLQSLEERLACKASQVLLNCRTLVLLILYIIHVES